MGDMSHAQKVFIERLIAVEGAMGTNPNLYAYSKAYR
jgi:hypothetical protein